MKKMLLLLVSGLLIVCLAGSAMASSSKILDENGNTVSGSTLSLVPGQPVKLTYEVLYDGSANSADLGTFNYNVWAIPKSNGALASDVTIMHPADFSLIETGSPNALFKDKDAIIVTLDPAKVDHGDKYKLVVGSLEIYLLASTNVTAVPEFPTVALPVAAMLGLLFVFGRKKEGL